MKQHPIEELRVQAGAGPPYPAAFLAALRRDPRPEAAALHAQCLLRMPETPAEKCRLETLSRFEHDAQAQGFQRVAGVDEAGRGPLAGPIVAAAVVLDSPVAGLNDSKQLTAAQRGALFDILHGGAHVIGVGVVDARTIDAIGIQSANYRAMAEAVAQVEPPPDFLLVDGFNLRGVAVPQMRLVKGDARSISIAAASIVAKVTRDRIMDALEDRYPGYGFAQHKGYATKGHLEALMRLGPCPEHRRSFAPLAQAQETGLLFE